jgi:hypothetical protein
MAFKCGDYYSERQSGGTGVSHDEAVRIANEMSLTQDVPDDVLLKIYEYRCEVTQRDQAGRPTVTEFGLEPTAEWSRITQALKERDELAAELERVKAERDEWQKTHEDHVWETIEHIDAMKKDRQSAIDLLVKAKGVLRQYREELKSLKSRLPVNADGDVVLWGDEVWMWDADSEKPIWGPVELITDHDGEDGKTEFMLTGHLPDEEIDFNSPAQYTYSTAESCRAAHEGKEGER